MVLKILIKIFLDSQQKDNNNTHYQTMGVMMLNFVLTELAKPIIRRLGTIMGTTLLSMGYATDQTVELETAVTSAALILVDLFLSYKDRKK
jgi:hypothetical protein